MSDQRLDNIERRLALEARARKNIQVTGGNNVLVSKFGDDFILDAIDEEGSINNDCFQWNVIFKGGSIPVKSSHAVIDRPESVNLVRPPTATIITINENKVINHSFKYFI